ncbi:MAG: hypothetical protein N2749_04625 [Clostridia bacterium]|nr:hypothetical protein [Clostridia bacterium]
MREKLILDGRLEGLQSCCFWTDDNVENLKEILIDEENLISEPTTMYDIFALGLNIGRSDLTARYLVRAYRKAGKNAELIIGDCSFMRGTKSYREGKYRFIRIDEKYIIDPTIMIAIPIPLSEKLGYTIISVVASDCAELFSKYEFFKDYHDQYIKDPFGFNNQLLQI